VLFVVLGLALVWLGYWLKWDFVRNMRFRLLHLVAMGYVVYESLANRDCPLTTWENQLRMSAGDGVYQVTFMVYWIHHIMYYDFSPQTFTIIYVLFFTALVLSFFYVKVKWEKK
jgi:hypothetical protein